MQINFSFRDVWVRMDMTSRIRVINVIDGYTSNDNLDTTPVARPQLH